MMRQIQFDLFRERTGITHIMRGTQIVSLRDVTKVYGIEMMSRTYLANLLHSVTLEGNIEKSVYEGCAIEFATVDPRMLLLGQTFVERSKCASLLESFSTLFSDYCVSPGFSRSHPMIIYGETQEKIQTISHYLPPIIESHKGKLLLIDGIHRNFLTKAVGATIDSIVIRNPLCAFPCGVHDWSHVKSVDIKPPRNERFRNLRTHLFRSFKESGIDG